MQRKYPLSGSSLGRYFDAPAFFIALFAGILLVYLFAPKRTVVYRFPSPHNADDAVYNDPAQPAACYRYQAERVQCESVPAGQLKPQPLVLEGSA